MPVTPLLIMQRHGKTDELKWVRDSHVVCVPLRMKSYEWTSRAVPRKNRMFHPLQEAEWYTCFRDKPTPRQTIFLSSSSSTSCLNSSSPASLSFVVIEFVGFRPDLTTSKTVHFLDYENKSKRINEILFIYASLFIWFSWKIKLSLFFLIYQNYYIFSDLYTLFCRERSRERVWVYTCMRSWIPTMPMRRTLRMRLKDLIVFNGRFPSAHSNPRTPKVFSKTRICRNCFCY